MQNGGKDVVLVTGAKGFVGTALCRQLQDLRYRVRGFAREQPVSIYERASHEPIEWVVNNEWTSEEDLARAVAGADAIVHLAARVHVMAETAADPLAEFRRVNVDWTNKLARAAVAHGVRRFVYVSSIKVNGEHTVVPFTETDPPNPQDPYACSKWEAEQALTRIAGETGLEVVIVRPPLVYGPGVGGNFLQLLKSVYQRWPLPFALVENRRSMLFIGNLVDALATCLRHPAASGNTYLVSDGEDISTSALIRRLAYAMGRSARLWPVPPVLLDLLGRLVSKEAVIDRLVNSLQIDSSKITRELAWAPSFTMDHGLGETARWFRSIYR